MIRIAICIILLLPAVRGAAQDIILKTDGGEIEALVTEITDTHVKYKRFSNPDGPVFNIAKAQIFSITYRNGQKDIFGLREPSATVAKESAVQSPASAAIPAYPYPPVSRAYAVGETFDEGGVKGIVFHTTDEGRHGLIMSLEEFYAIWGGVSILRGEKFFETHADNRQDGWANLWAIAACVGKGTITWNNFYATKLCAAKGKGWYLPASDEVYMILLLFNGGSVDEPDLEAQNAFNAMLIKAGAKKMMLGKPHCTSTEYDDLNALTVDFKIKPGTPPISVTKKNMPMVVRPVHKF